MSRSRRRIPKGLPRQTSGGLAHTDHRGSLLAVSHSAASAGSARITVQAERIAALATASLAAATVLPAACHQQSVQADGESSASARIAQTTSHRVTSRRFWLIAE